jgi:hypothetical protein
MKIEINQFTKSCERYKIFCLLIENQKIIDLVVNLETEGVKSINIGKELAIYIDNLKDFSYLNIDVYDYVKNILDKHKSKINDKGNDVIAIYNLGILMEPNLELNAVQLFKEFSKSTSLVILWDNQFDIPDRLVWSTQKNNFFLDFSESQLKKLEYAI